MCSRQHGINYVLPIAIWQHIIYIYRIIYRMQTLDLFVKIDLWHIFIELASDYSLDGVE